MIIQIAALALTAYATTTAPPAPPTTTVPVTTLPTQPTTTVPSGPTTTIPIPEGYTPLADFSQTIVVAVPDAWQEVDVSPAILADESEVPRIAASPDLASFYSSFDTPGLQYLALPYAEDPLTVMHTFGLTSGCVSTEVKEYDDPIFVGVIQIGTDCGPQHMTWNTVVASPADHSFTAMLQIQSVDPDELKNVLLTFNVA